MVQAADSLHGSNLALLGGSKSVLSGASLLSEMVRKRSTTEVGVVPNHFQLVPLAKDDPVIALRSFCVRQSQP